MASAWPSRGNPSGRALALLLVPLLYGCGGRDALPPSPPASGWLDIDDGLSAQEAPWTLEGPDAFTLSATGDSTLNLTVGEYQLTWGHVAGWLAPVAATVDLSIAEGDTARAAAEFERVRRLTSHAGNDKHPAVSVRGQIAFTSDRSGNEDIWILEEINTGEPWRLTVSSYRDFDPTWAPSSWHEPAVVFTSNRSGAFNLWYQATSGTPATIVTDCYMDCYFSEPSWSPGLAYIVFTTRFPGWNDDLYRVVPGQAETRLVYYDAEDNSPDGGSEQPFVVFASDRFGDYEILLQEMWRGDTAVPADAGKDDPPIPVTNLTNDQWPNDNPSLSPDGVQVAFTTDFSGNSEICAMPLAGGGMVVLAADPAQDLYPCWTPDGRAIVFSSNRSGSYNLWMVAAD